MKKISLITTLLVALILIASVAVPRVSAIEEPANPKVIKVTGSSSITAIPDTAYINIGVKTENENLAKAQEDSKNKMSDVTKSIKDLGIEEKDIRTIYYNVSPKYVWNEKNSENTITGYTVQTQVEVKIVDTDKVGKLIDNVTKAGSNIINSVRFDLADQTEIYNQALELAVKNAETKALAMGKSYNITKLKPIRIEEISNSYNYIGLTRGAVAEDYRATPINVGEMSITASVNVEFGY